MNEPMPIPKEGIRHGYWNVRTIAPVGGFLSFCAVFCITVVVASLFEHDESKPGGLGIGVCLLLVILGALALFLAGFRKSSITLYPDRLVFVTMGGEKVELDATEIQRTYLYRRAHETLPTLVVKSTGWQKFVIYNTIERWDDLLQELQTMSGKPIEP